MAGRRTRAVERTETEKSAVPPLTANHVGRLAKEHDIVATMRELGVIFVTVVLAGCATTRCSGSPTQAPRGKIAIPADLQAQVEQSIDLGREIDLQSKAAAIGTYGVNERLGFLVLNGMEGYITIR